MARLLLLLLLAGCSLKPEIQVERVCMRYINTEEGWRAGQPYYAHHFYDEYNRVEYVEYSSKKVSYQAGECITGFVKR